MAIIRTEELCYHKKDEIKNKKMLLLTTQRNIILHFFNGF